MNNKKGMNKFGAALSYHIYYEVPRIVLVRGALRLREPKPRIACCGCGQNAIPCGYEIYCEAFEIISPQSNVRDAWYKRGIEGRTDN